MIRFCLPVFLEVFKNCGTHLSYLLFPEPNDHTCCMNFFAPFPTQQEMKIEQLGRHEIELLFKFSLSAIDIHHFLSHVAHKYPCYHNGPSNSNILTCIFVLSFSYRFGRVVLSSWTYPTPPIFAWPRRPGGRPGCDRRGHHLWRWRGGGRRGGDGTGWSGGGGRWSQHQQRSDGRYQKQSAKWDDSQQCVFKRFRRELIK